MRKISAVLIVLVLMFGVFLPLIQITTQNAKGADPITLDVYASSDTYTTSSSATSNFNSADNIRCGNYSSGQHYGYFKFNLSSYAGATAVYATLKLYMWNQGSFATLYVKAITSSCDFSTVTHNTRPSLSTTNYAEFTSNAQNQYNNINITSLVNAWLSGSLTNYGLAVVAKYPTYNDYYAMYRSIEYTGTDKDPKIALKYTPAPPAGWSPTFTNNATTSVYYYDYWSYTPTINETGHFNLENAPAWVTGHGEGTGSFYIDGTPEPGDSSGAVSISAHSTDPDSNGVKTYQNFTLSILSRNITNVIGNLTGFDETTALMYALSWHCDGQTIYAGMNQNFPGPSGTLYYSGMTIDEFWYIYFYLTAHYGYDMVRIGPGDAWGSEIMYETYTYHTTKFYEVIDSMLNASWHNGVKICLVLAGSQNADVEPYEFMGVGNARVVGTSAYTNYLAYVKTIMTHYGYNDNITMFDLWNEPDSYPAPFWPSGVDSAKAWTDDLSESTDNYHGDTPRTIGIGTGSPSIFTLGQEGESNMNHVWNNSFEVCQMHIYGGSLEDQSIINNFQNYYEWAYRLNKPLFIGELADNTQYPLERWEWAETQLRNIGVGAIASMVITGTADYPYTGSTEELAPISVDYSPDENLELAGGGDYDLYFSKLLCGSGPAGYGGLYYYFTYFAGGSLWYQTNNITWGSPYPARTGWSNPHLINSSSVLIYDMFMLNETAIILFTGDHVINVSPELEYDEVLCLDYIIYWWNGTGFQWMKHYRFDEAWAMGTWAVNDIKITQDLDSWDLEGSMYWVYWVPGYPHGANGFMQRIYYDNNALVNGRPNGKMYYGNILTMNTNLGMYGTFTYTGMYGFGNYLFVATVVGNDNYLELIEFQSEESWYLLQNHYHVMQNLITWAGSYYNEYAQVDAHFLAYKAGSQPSVGYVYYKVYCPGNSTYIERNWILTFNPDPQVNLAYKYPVAVKVTGGATVINLVTPYKYLWDSTGKVFVYDNITNQIVIVHNDSIDVDKIYYEILIQAIITETIDEGNGFVYFNYATVTPINDYTIIQTVHVYISTDYPVASSLNVMGIIWLLIMFLPAIVMAGVMGRWGFILGISIIATILAFSMDGFWFIAIFVYIGSGILIMKGGN